MEKTKTQLNQIMSVLLITAILCLIYFIIHLVVSGKVALFTVFVLVAGIIYYLQNKLQSSVNTEKLSPEQKRLIDYIVKNFPKNACEKVKTASKSNSQGWMQLLVIINKFYQGLKDETAKTQKDFLNKL